ncbi:uncharacterized protein ACN427_011857 isoform 1-T7 [Glossina fuscipes fuscipes]
MWLHSLAFVAILLLGLKTIATSQAQVAEVSRSPRAIDLSTFVRNLLLKSAAASDLKTNIKATPVPRRRPATTLRPPPQRALPPPPQSRYNPNVFFQKSGFGFPFNFGYGQYGFNKFPNFVYSNNGGETVQRAPRPQPTTTTTITTTTTTQSPPATPSPPSRRPIVYRPKGRFGKPNFFSYDYNYDDYDYGDPNPPTDPPPSSSPPSALPMTPPPTAAPQPRPRPRPGKYSRLRPTQLSPPATGEPQASREAPPPAPEEPPAPAPPPPPSRRPIVYRPKGRFGKPNFFSYDYNYGDYDYGDPNPATDPPTSSSQPPAPPMTPPPPPTAQPGLEENPILRPTQPPPPATEGPPASEKSPSSEPEQPPPPPPPLQTSPAPRPRGRPPQQLRNQLLYQFAAPDDTSTNDAEPPSEQPQSTPDDPNGNSPGAPDAVDDTGDFADSRDVFSPENASEDYIDDNSNDANNDGRQFLQPSRLVDFANDPPQSPDSAPIFDTPFPSNGAPSTQPASYETRFPTNLQYQHSYGSALSSNNPFFEGFSPAYYPSSSSPDYNLPIY